MMHARSLFRLTSGLTFALFCLMLTPAMAEAQNGTLRLVALGADSPVQLETTSATYQDIPDTHVTFKTGKNSCVLAQFSMFSRGDFGNVFVRALSDGQEMKPYPVRFGAHIPTPGTLTFFHCSVQKGAHDLVMQYRSANEGSAAVIAERSLVVMEARGFKPSAIAP